MSASAAKTSLLPMGIHGSESFAADWIYAASFAAHDDGAYLAGYSGRVVRVDGNGRGIRIYDIGSVPRRILDTGDFLYLLTDTRLYVLRDNALHALIDTHEGGDLVMTETGFGLIEKKAVALVSRRRSLSRQHHHQGPDPPDLRQGRKYRHRNTPAARNDTRNAIVVGQTVRKMLALPKTV